MAVVSMGGVGFCLVAIATNGAAQTIIVGQAGDDYYRFTSLGIDPGGTIVIVGQDDDGAATAFRVIGTDFELTPLRAPPSGGDSEVTKISTDARYAIGTFRPVDENDRGVLWDLTRPTEPIDLGTIADQGNPRPMAVCSSSAGPAVVGQSGRSGFVWTAETGARPWVTNRPYLALAAPVAINRDATQVVGWEATISGTNIVTQPIRGTLTRYELLESHDSSRASAEAISPSGDWACGIADFQSVIWDAKGHPRFLKLGTNFHGLLTITDRGVAAGVSAIGGIIYEGRGRQLPLR